MTTLLRRCQFVLMAVLMMTARPSRSATPLLRYTFDEATAGATAALNLARARLPDEHTALGSAIAHDLATLASFKDADLVAAAAEFGALGSASRGWTAAGRGRG